MLTWNTLFSEYRNDRGGLNGFESYLCRDKMAFGSKKFGQQAAAEDVIHE